MDVIAKLPSGLSIPPKVTSGGAQYRSICLNGRSGDVVELVVPIAGVPRANWLGLNIGDGERRVDCEAYEVSGERAAAECI